MKVCGFVCAYFGIFGALVIYLEHHKDIDVMSYVLEYKVFAFVLAALISCLKACESGRSPHLSGIEEAEMQQQGLVALEEGRN